MNKKSIFSLILVIVLTISIAFTGCSKDEDAGQTTTTAAESYADGVYFAMDDQYAESGWRSVVTLEVKDGEIVMVDWNAAHKSGGIDKKTSSQEGIYGMVEKGGAVAEWHEQAELVEEYLLETQDPKDIEYKDDEGHTDAIAGVTIHVNDFYALVEKALAKGPVGYGMYKDGTYHAEEAEFSENGWKEMIDVTVISGYITAVNWDPKNTEGESKKALSEDGTYGMVAKGGAQSEWHEQAALVEEDIVENQDLGGYEASDDEGSIDSVAGVSIHVMQIIELLKDVIEMR